MEFIRDKFRNLFSKKTPLTEMEREEKLNSNFSRLLRDEINQSNSEVEAIENAVNNYVDKIMEVAECTDPRFRMKEKIPVGSMVEGTRIKNPNEFDFMLVLSELSKPGVIELKQECCDVKTSTRVYIKELDVLERYTELCDETSGRIRCSRGGNGFFQRLTQTDDGDSCFKRRFFDVIQTSIQTSEGSQFSDYLGCIQGIKAFVHGPAVSVLCKWESSIDRKSNSLIMIDLVPAMEFDDLQNCVDKINPNFVNGLNKVGHFHVVPVAYDDQCPYSACFSISFAEAETNVVKDLDAHHKDCLKIMKYILIYSKDLKFLNIFTSYTLKCLILRHSIDCSKKHSLSLCIRKILFEIKSMFEMPNIDLPSIFLNEHNVYSCKDPNKLRDEYNSSKDNFDIFLEKIEMGDIKCKTKISFSPISPLSKKYLLSAFINMYFIILIIEILFLFDYPITNNYFKFASTYMCFGLLFFCIFRLDEQRKFSKTYLDYSCCIYISLYVLKIAYSLSVMSSFSISGLMFLFEFLPLTFLYFGIFLCTELLLLSVCFRTLKKHCFHVNYFYMILLYIMFNLYLYIICYDENARFFNIFNFCCLFILTTLITIIALTIRYKIICSEKDTLPTWLKKYIDSGMIYNRLFIAIFEWNEY